MNDSSERESLKLFGQKLTEFRKSKKLSLEKLANMAEIDMSGLHRIEKGKAYPNLLTVFRLAKALEISPAELFK